MSRRPALYELTVARMKEFLREPEAVFWVFFFPMALAVALGFAFREKPPDRTPIGVVSGAGADTAVAALGRSPLLLPRVMPEAAGREALRTGKISLLVEPGPPAVFHFDETRPDSRIARLAADDALHRLPHPRPARHEPDEHRRVEHRLRGHHGAQPQAAQKAPRDTDAEIRLSALAHAVAAGLPDLRGRLPHRLRLDLLRRRGA